MSHLLCYIIFSRYASISVGNHVLYSCIIIFISENLSIVTISRYCYDKEISLSLSASPKDAVLVVFSDNGRHQIKNKNHTGIPMHLKSVNQTNKSSSKILLKWPVIIFCSPLEDAKTTSLMWHWLLT